LASFASFSTGSQPVHHRGNKDGVHALGDKGAHGFDLVFLFLLTVGNLQGDTAFLSFAFATLVSAARQPDSDPTCENPTVKGQPSP
jgi:hypothetical protein